MENISAQTGVSVESAKQAGEMVAQQTEAVREVIGVFQDMSDAMDKLFDGLKEILAGTERADKEREYIIFLLSLRRRQQAPKW